MEGFAGISRTQLDEILSGIRNLHVVLIGDVCVDVYWRADMTRSELSRETPHFPLPIVEERMSLGAAGNVAANLAALKTASVRLIGVIGRDWRGDAVARLLREIGMDADGLVLSRSATTNAYCKPMRRGHSDVEYEDPRLDFRNLADPSEEDEDALLRLLTQSLASADVLCVSDQFPFGCITERIREGIRSFAREGLPVIVDSRDRIGLFSDVTLKPNEMEAYRAVRQEYDPGRVTLDSCAEVAAELAERNRAKVCMTLGAKGSLYVEAGQGVHVPSYDVPPPLDICGAGDAFLAAFSSALAAGAVPREACSLANLAADVTIRKIGVTGTASPQEILARHAQVFGPDRTVS